MAIIQGSPGGCVMAKAKKRVNAEKRQHPRLRINPGMPAIRVALQPLSGGEEGLLRGKVHNFSAGGFCLVADHMVRPSQVFRCVIPFPDLPFVIPTLLRTRSSRGASRLENTLRVCSFFLTGELIAV